MRYRKQNGEEVIFYTNDEKEKALEVSLTALAASLGYTPVRQGTHYSLKEMDSLMIYNDRTWNRWSGRGTHNGGSQIDFLLEFGNVNTVPEAIQQLLEFKGEAFQDIYVEQPRHEDNTKHDLVLPPHNSNYRRLFAYLIQTRGLSQKVVSYFVDKKLIYEDAVHHNIVYCGYDPEGTIRYAGLRGTADIYGKKYKMDCPGNDKNYGVNIVNEESNVLKVFESVIDCMSYMDMYDDYQSNKLVLGMVADNPLEQFIRDYHHIKKITFCLDNDAAGQNAIYGVENRKVGLKEKYEARGFVVSVDIPPAGKDFNESLIASNQMSNKSYVSHFYDNMMRLVNFRRENVKGEMATVKYVASDYDGSLENEYKYYLSDGYGDIYSWICNNPNISEKQKESAASANEVVRKICMIRNKQGDIGFYMENCPEEKYILANSDGYKYPPDKRHLIFSDFDGLLTENEINNLYSICNRLDQKQVNLPLEHDNVCEINNLHRKATR
jgi:hypothetical protein